MALISVKGFASKGYVSESDMLITVLPYIKGGFMVWLTSTFALKAHILTGWTVAPNIVKVSNEQVADLGRPWISFVINMEIAVW
jgi:hypothetical protein